VSVFEPASRRVFLCPGAGSDKARTQAADLFVLDLDGQVLEGQGHVPLEWPIHTSVHAARSDALAVAHLHAPYATLFAIAEREFRPVTLHGSIFGDGVPLYTEALLVETPAQGRNLVGVLADKRAALLRGHGLVVVGGDIEEVLYGALILEDNARKALQAATLGPVGVISPEECQRFEADGGMRGRSRLMWKYFSELEARWDRQPATGAGPLA
jgi:ribulose-5-phosphate 4-epimerase/fuculose-1-phosphate aldolase